MIDIVDRLRFDATRCEVQFSKGVAGNIDAAADEIMFLRNALKTIDDIAVSKKAGAAKKMQEVARIALAHTNGDR